MSHPWFPFYVSDYIASTRHLDAGEHGVYLLLLMESWIRGPLPNDLSRLCRMAADAPEKDVLFILDEFWKLTENGWINNRLERERAKVEQTYHRKVVRRNRYLSYLKSEKWSQVRNAALDRDGGVCRLCGAPATQAHHTQYPKNLQEDHPDNVIAICRDCHKAAHHLR